MNSPSNNTQANQPPNTTEESTANSIDETTSITTTELAAPLLRRENSTTEIQAINEEIPPPWNGVLKKELEQSWPLMLRGAVVAGRYFAISIMLGKTNEQLLAPNTLINALESIYIIFGGRSLSIVGSMISKLKGENEPEKIAITFRQGIVFATLLSLPATAGYYFANHHLLAGVGQHPFAVEKAKHYFQAASAGYLPLMLMTAQQRLLQGLHRPIPVLLSNLLHSSLSVLASYIFLFGKLGTPKLEMKGVGYAFAIAGWGALLANSIYIASTKTLSEIPLFSRKSELTSDNFKRIILKGLPTGLQFTTENIANLINSIFLGLHNLTALSADQMASQIALAISIANGGLAQGISVCVGESLGREKYNAIKRYGNTGILLGTLFPIVSAILFLTLKLQFISLFIDTKKPENAELVRLASLFVLLEPLRQLTTGIQFTTTGALLGLQNTAFTMKTSVACSLILNAGILCLMHYALHQNSIALFSAKAIGVGVAATLNTGYWLLQSQEQSNEDKNEVMEMNVCQRLSRSMGLFCNQKREINPSEIENTYTPVDTSAVSIPA